MKRLHFFAAPAAGLSALALSFPTFAAPIDVTKVVTEVGLQIPSITSIGGAVLLVLVALAAFAWVRRAL